MELNNNFQKLSDNYLFAEVGAKVKAFMARNSGNSVIRMDIGDVTLPLIAPVRNAMIGAVNEMAVKDSFHGYGPEQGYLFLREAIARHDYQDRGIQISPDEIFVSDGAKCDIGNLTDIFYPDCVVGIPNPVYPVYVDSNIMAGRTIENGKLVMIECDQDNGYKPIVPDSHLDVVYLCSPNNPTGTVLNRQELSTWVDYAVQNRSLIVFDSAYEAFIRNPELPRSIYEIPGAEKVAIEIRSYSKTAGFTGIRCGYTVVPETLMGCFQDDKLVALKNLWLRRQTTKFNGVGYVVQKGAEALYSDEAQFLIAENINYYLANACLLRDCFFDKGFKVTGGTDSPYVWIKSTQGLSSWEMFDILLSRLNLSCTPGVGFGSGGEGCIRLTGFNSKEYTEKAVERLNSVSSDFLL